MITLEKKCLECGTPIHGRMDKKYCSDQCRSNHFNRVNPGDYHHIRKINSILRKNWRILSDLSTDKRPIHSQVLRIKGFDFNYFTSKTRSNSGHTCFFCYNKAYLQLNEDHFLLLNEVPWTLSEAIPEHIDRELVRDPMT